MTSSSCSPDINPNTVVREGVKGILDKLEWFLNQQFGRNCTELTKTDYGVSFTFHEEVEVDLLPSPYWDGKRGFHEFMRPLSDKDRRK